MKTWKNIEGWITEIEASCLQWAVSSRGTRVILEVGAWKGKSTVCMASCLHGDSKLYTIDPFDGSGEDGSHEEYKRLKGPQSLLDQFMDNIQACGVSDRVIPVVGLSSDVADKVPQVIDVLFIDGDHSIRGCLTDYELFAPRVKKGGLILFHDYDPSRPGLGPTYVVDNKASKQLLNVDIFGSIWVGRAP